MFNFFKLYKIPILFVSFILYTVLVFGSAWKTHTYYDGYQQNLENKVQLIVKQGISEYQRNQAQGLEDQKNLLDSVKTNTILKEKTILQQPIYQQQCIDQSGVDLLKEYKEKSASIINGKP